MRICPHCKKEKEFYSDKSSWCKDCSREYAKKRYEREGNVLRERVFRWKEKNKDKYNQMAKNVNKKRREAVLFGLGGNNPKCKCCGEKISEFLEVDHINNDGSNERKLYGSAMYLEIIKQGFPKDKYQLLCRNCNHAKHIYGKCPHKTKTI
jgi:hypothetical protein